MGSFVPTRAFVGVAHGDLCHRVLTTLSWKPFPFLGLITWWFLSRALIGSVFFFLWGPCLYFYIKVYCWAILFFEMTWNWKKKSHKNLVIFTKLRILSCMLTCSDVKISTIYIVKQDYKVEQFWLIFKHKWSAPHACSYSSRLGASKAGLSWEAWVFHSRNYQEAFQRRYHRKNTSQSQMYLKCQYRWTIPQNTKF